MSNCLKSLFGFASEAAKGHRVQLPLRKLVFSSNIQNRVARVVPHRVVRSRPQLLGHPVSSSGLSSWLLLKSPWSQICSECLHETSPTVAVATFFSKLARSKTNENFVQKLSFDHLRDFWVEKEEKELFLKNKSLSFLCWKKHFSFSFSNEF